MAKEAQDNNLRIAGYASLFGKTDLDGDVVKPGAFEAFKGGTLPMLHGHDTAEPVGIWDVIRTDHKGLWVEGTIMGGSEKADRLIRLIKWKAVTGLSIGYRTRKVFNRHGGGRDLLAVDLWEISVVAFPMLTQARLKIIGDTYANETN